MATMSDLPFLTDAEIAGICDGVKMASAQRRHLKRLGLHVEQKPNGRPLVARSEFERVLGAARLSDVRKQPAGDVAALRARWGNKHGAQAQGR
jgi:hypothetical protein